MAKKKFSEGKLRSPFDFINQDHVLTICRQIVENNTLHALRIYQDTTSKAVRLQASIHRGEMKR